MVKMKMSDKEKEALSYIISFIDKCIKFRDEDKWDEINDTILEYAYNCRMVNTFGCEPNQGAMFLALNYINMMIPSLFKDKDITPIEFAEEFDKEVDAIFMEKFKKFIKTDKDELTNKTE